MNTEIVLDIPSFLNTVVTMFVILIVGYILGKMNVIGATASKNFSKLIVTVGQPALIINSIISSRYSFENFTLSLKSLGAAFIMHFIMAAIAFVLCMKIKDSDERKITEFAMVFGNIGFLGIPLLGSLFGDKGRFAAAFFVVCFNILLWIIGLAIIARGRDDIKMTAKKIFLNKGTIPTVIGYFLFLIPSFIPSFELPKIATMSVSYIAGLCTPISMLIIGALLARKKLSQIFTNGKVYYLCLFKLIAIPLFFCILTKALGFSDFWVVFITVASAMPSASSTSMFAELYDTAPEYSAQCVGASTLFSIATMPLLVLLAKWITSFNFGLFPFLQNF